MDGNAKGMRLFSHAHLGLEVHTVGFCHGSWKGKLLEVATHAHAHRQRRETQLGQVELAILGQALHTIQLPVVDVLGVLANTVVVGEHLEVVSIEVGWGGIGCW